MNQLSRSNPDFIVQAFNWTQQSGGPRILHSLVRNLRQLGVNAFWSDPCHHEPGTEHFPVWTPAVRTDNDIVMVYPEITRGTPLGHGDLCVRYLLNYPGRAGQDVTDSWGSTDLLYHFYPSFRWKDSKQLFVPFLDEKLFNLDDCPSERKGTLFYAKKANISAFHDEYDLSPHVRTLAWPELAQLMKRSRYIRVGEETAIALEAEMCGCKTIFTINGHMRQPPITLQDYRAFEAKSRSNLLDFIGECKQRLKVMYG